MNPKYCQYCGSPLDEGCDCAREIAQAERDFIDEYYDRPDVRYGLAQQDLIGLHRFEQ